MKISMLFSVDVVLCSQDDVDNDAEGEERSQAFQANEVSSI